MRYSIGMFMMIILWAAAGMAADIHVPGDQPTIRAAVTAAQEGDTIILADGTFTGADNRDITVDKALIFRSENGPELTILDAESHSRFFEITADVETRFTGITFQNGFEQNYYGIPGGAIYAGTSPPALTIIDRCIFLNNGIDCIESGEHASAHGGAVFGAVQISNSLFKGNFCTSDIFSGGGAVSGSDQADPITHCTFFGNSVASDDYVSGGAVSNCTLENCIVWNNLPLDDQLRECTATYSDVQNGHEGEGNIQTDPLFVSTDPLDFHLSQGSPCIDTGAVVAVDTDLDGDARPNHAGYDMGADEYYGPWYTPTPTGTPVDTPTVTPTPPVPCQDLGISLNLSPMQVYPGDTFLLSLEMCNPGPEPIDSARIYLILEVYGSYFFWPLWTADVTSYQMDLSAGLTVQAVFNFTWPPTGVPGSATFIAAMTDADFTQALGTWSIAAFSWE